MAINPCAIPYVQTPYKEILKKLFDILTSWLEAAALPESAVRATATFTAALIWVAGCVMLYLFLKLIANHINKKVEDTETKIDDIFLSRKVVNAICLLVISIIITKTVPGLTLLYPTAYKAVTTCCSVLTIGAVTYLLVLESSAFCNFLRMRNVQHAGVLVLRNVLQSIIGVVAGLLIISTILNRDLAYVISALGAMAAVLMLVFKDSILGAIAGIRLSVNGMLKENDWIIVPRYNADGRVEDLSLTTVKVRNWDKSISTIPPHALVSEGFINKERMLDMGVRQIRRTFFVDIESVRKLDAEETARLADKEWCGNIDLSQSAVNLSLFRRWLRHAMRNHPRIAESTPETAMQVFVRELPATPTGLPLEVFFFVRCLDWEEFEELQADFIDEITAAFPRFGLRLYQSIASAAFPAK